MSTVDFVVSMLYNIYNQSRKDNMPRLYDETYPHLPVDYLQGTQDPSYFVKQIRANIDNNKLSDKDFRRFISNTLPLYEEKKSKSDQ